MASLFAQLEQRRCQLKMTVRAVAKASGVSLPTVNRILSGTHPGASCENLFAIAEALGLEIVARSKLRVDELRKRRARDKAVRLVDVVQGTSALEGQGLSRRDREEMIERTTSELLASNRRLWSE